VEQIRKEAEEPVRLQGFEDRERVELEIASLRYLVLEAGLFRMPMEADLPTLIE